MFKTFQKGKDNVCFISAQGHAFIVHLLESVYGDEGNGAPSHQQKVPQWSKGVSPKSTLEGSGSFAEDGRG